MLLRTPFFFFFTAKGRKKILIRELNFNVAFRDNAFKLHRLYKSAYWILKLLILLRPCHSQIHVDCKYKPILSKIIPPQI
jgi:hypothetical protein